MRVWNVLGICSLGVMSACGGSTSDSGGGSTTVKGQAGGQAVPATDTFAIVGGVSGTTTTGATYTQANVSILITNIANSCGLVQRHGDAPNTTTLGLLVQVVGSSVPTGTYPITAPAGVDAPGATSYFRTTDADCSWKTNEIAASGSITLTAVSSTGDVWGTFDVTMSNGDHLTGSFDAPVCAASLVGDGGAPVCGS
jgi:hypothetical protein